MDKIKMFNRYAENLRIVRSRMKFQISGSDENTNIYVCPLSLKVFSSEGLKSDYEDQLTLEHVPPKSLGGKGVLLTNKISNSQAGHTIDANLLNYLLHKSFKAGTGSIPVKYKFNNQYTISGSLLNKNQLSFNFAPKEMHYGAKRILDLLQSKNEISLDFNIIKPKDPSIALIRIAYLIAFSNIGYSLIFGAAKYLNPNIDLIRKQISSPSESILDDVVVLEWDLPDEFLGINIIYEPKDIRSLLIVFDLNIEGQNYRFCVMLPGPDNFGFLALKNLKSMLQENKSVDFKAYTFPEKLMLENSVDSFKYWKYWGDLNGWTR